MRSIGRYRLVARIGAGSFATVWLGHDDDLDVPVAVKVLADNWASNPDVRNRFLAEARIMRRTPVGSVHRQRSMACCSRGWQPTGTAARRPLCCWRKAWKPSGLRCSQAVPRDRVRRAA
jgi:hypothetical protein